MNEIKVNGLIKTESILNAHDFLLDFLSLFEGAKRGGIHDFIEISVYNMINSAIKSIDDYLADGHKSVDATQVINIVLESYQKVLDNMKRNLDKIEKVNFK